MIKKMKNFIKNIAIKKTSAQKAIASCRIFSTLTLLGFVSLGMLLADLNPAIAKQRTEPLLKETLTLPTVLTLFQDEKVRQTSGVSPLSVPSNPVIEAGSLASLPISLPQRLADALRQDLAQRANLPLAKLSIIEAEQQSWPDSCLGLANPEEMCTQSQVNGWRAGVSDGEKTWFYRIDSSGKKLRLENQNSPRLNLTATIADAVLQNIAERSGLSVSAFRITQAEQKTWSDGCLGLGAADILCTEALVPGWEVTVENNHHRWTYRTDQSGLLVKLDEAGSQVSNLVTQSPGPIAEDQLPPPLPEKVIFRAIASGGITGRSEETLLFEDGRVIQGPLTTKGSTFQRQICQASPTAVKEFQQLLIQRQLSQFDRFSYPAPTGAADFITITLTSKEATIRYADIAQHRLPEDLQQVVQAWNQLTRPEKSKNKC